MLLNWFQIVTFSEVSYGWVFTKTDETAGCSTEDTLTDWQRFKFFMHIESMFFIANLFGAILFMIFRSMAHNQINWDIEEDEKWEETDAIVENLDQIHLLQQVFTPWFI